MIGRPLIILPYDRPGCWARVEGFLLAWARRLVWVLIGFGAGFVVGGCQ